MCPSVSLVHYDCSRVFTLMQDYRGPLYDEPRALSTNLVSQGMGRKLTRATSFQATANIQMMFQSALTQATAFCKH